MKLGKLSGALTLWRGGAIDKPARNVPAPWVPPLPAAWVPPAREADRPRLLFAVDGTHSRAVAWAAAKRLTDSLFKALPGSLDVALAVHGGGRLHTFTHFTADPGELRDLASGVTCQLGSTRLLDILKRVLKIRGVSTVLYIGDAFEEDEGEARRIAAALGKRRTRVIILHDGPPLDVFAVIAERSGGALLPFDASAIDALSDLFEVVAVLAAGDVEALKTAAPTMPAATLLLEHLTDRKAIGRRGGDA
jgi:hypothetical protein